MLLFSKSQRLELWAVRPFQLGMRTTTGKAPPRTVTQVRLSPFVFSLSNYSFRLSRSYATHALVRDYLRETEAAGF